MNQRALVKNTADEGQVKEATLKIKDRRKQELEDMRFLLATIQGRRFVWRYLEECGVFRTSFTGSSETYFLEGQRNIGLKLLADVNEADVNAYVLMMKENKKENA